MSPIAACAAGASTPLPTGLMRTFICKAHAVLCQRRRLGRKALEGSGLLGQIQRRLDPSFRQALKGIAQSAARVLTTRGASATSCIMNWAGAT